MAIEGSQAGQSPDPITASRLERVQFYLERRLGKEERTQHIQKRQQIRGNLFQGIVPPFDHSSFHDFVEGMANQPVPPQTTEPIYHSLWETGVFGETLSLLNTFPGQGDRELSLAATLRAQCGFTDFQMNRTINGITESQLRLWEQLVEQSRIPLSNSWTEDQLLFEIFLATGKRPESLAQAAFAHFDVEAAGNKYKEHPTIEGDMWLLDIQIPRNDGQGFDCLEVDFRPRGHWGDGKPVYYLTHNNNTNNRSMRQALDHFTYSIEYCNGKGASQAVEVLKPEMLG